MAQIGRKCAYVAFGFLQRAYRSIGLYPCAQKWPILTLPCRGRGPVGALEASPAFKKNLFWRCPRAFSPPGKASLCPEDPVPCRQELP